MRLVAALYHNHAIHLLISGLAVAAARLDHNLSLFAMTLILATTTVAGTQLPAIRTLRQIGHGERAIPGGDRRPVRTVIVGAGVVGRLLAENLERNGAYNVVGFIDDNGEDFSAGKWPILGGRGHVRQVVESMKIDEVLIAYAPTWQQNLADDLTANLPRLSVRVVPTPFEACMGTARVQHHGDIAIVSLSGRSDPLQFRCKRVLDFVTALIGLFILSPLLFLAMAIIKLTSPGPILFAQERVGLHGRTFVMYKLRTMVIDAERSTGPIRSPGSADDRLTPVGKWLRLFRLDEIPQLWNVLTGEMSIVGPRPERPVFAEKYARATPAYVRRHEVVPGITGLAQVCGGYHTDARDKLRFDLIYISHWSLWTDLVIIGKTIAVILFPETRRFESNNPETA
jgi:exopolysaccharide biosynthesis polyprenyl glycosylphosphotransferase